MTAARKLDWQRICRCSELIPESGVCALIDKEQVAIFYLPSEKQPIYAIGNHDPLGGANILSRGIVGDINGELVVASPLYKQHFSLTSGQCLEHDDVSVTSYDIKIDGEDVLIRA